MNPSFCCPLVTTEFIAKTERKNKELVALLVAHFQIRVELENAAHLRKEQHGKVTDGVDM